MPTDVHVAVSNVFIVNASPSMLNTVPTAGLLYSTLATVILGEFAYDDEPTYASTVSVLNPWLFGIVKTPPCSENLSAYVCKVNVSGVVG